MKRLGGWWRLWIFLSVLWGVAVMSVCVWVWPSVERAYLSEEDMKLLTTQTQELLKKPLWMQGRVVSGDTSESGNRKQNNLDPVRGTQKKDILDGLKRVPTSHPTGYEFPPDEPSPEAMSSGQVLELLGTREQRKEARVDYGRVQALITRAARIKVVGYAFLIWLVPWLSILAFGLGFRWVVQGFKKEPAT